MLSKAFARRSRDVSAIHERKWYQTVLNPAFIDEEAGILPVLTGDHDMEQQPSLGSARVVLWDPNGSNRFVVGGGNELRLYEWNHRKGEVRQSGLRSDLGSMRCFAWSPHSVYNDLLAIGLQSGAVDICRLDQPITTTNVTTNFISGTLHQQSQPAIQPTITLSVNSRNRRPCTSLAFCRLNPNLLANGLDKFRAEFGLVIWDLEHSATAFEVSAIDDHFDKLTDPLPNNPTSTSLLYSSRGASKSALRSSSSNSTIPAEVQHRLASRGKSAYPKGVQDTNNPSGQYCQAEGINSCVFQSNSSWEVVAGVNNKLIRYFDLRVRSGKAINEAQTKAVRGICCDPFDGNLIASLDDVGVHVWDRRRHSQPILMFQEEDAGMDLDTLVVNAIPQAPTVGRITGVEFCNTRRNVLGTTTREGSYVRLWNLIYGENLGGEDMFPDNYSDSTDFHGERNTHTQGDWERRPSWDETNASPSEEQNLGYSADRGPLLAGSNRTKIFNKTISSFDFIPRSAAPTTPPHIVAVSRSGDIEVSVIRDPPQHVWSSRGELVASVGKGYKIYRTHSELEDATYGETWEGPTPDHQQLDEPTVNIHTTPLHDSEPPIPTQNHRLSHLSSGVRPTARRFSPAAALRSTLDKKQGPGSSISTPRPSPLVLQSDETVAPKSERNMSTPGRNAAIGAGSKTPKTSRSRLRASRLSEKQMAERGLMGDISAIIRRRVLRGYGLGSAKTNSEIVAEDSGLDDALSQIWLWLHTSNKILHAGDALTHIHGFDFTLKGVLPVWEGFEPLQRLPGEPAPTPSQWQPAVSRGRRGTMSALSATAPRAYQDKKFGNYTAALEWLNKRNTLSRTDGMSLPKSSKKVAQRQLGLSLVGWNYSDDELNREISRWESEFRGSGRAACWALFLGKQDRCMDILGRSKDETHRLLSALLLAGSVLQSSSGNSEASTQWRERCQTLAARLDDPYARMLLTWFMTKDWQETLQDVPIPLTERIAIALRFFDDSEVTAFLREKVEDTVLHGDLEGIHITGVNEDSVKILQAYIDHSGDVQTAAIIGSLAPRLYVQDKSPIHQRRHSLSSSGGHGYDVGSDGPGPSFSDSAIAQQIEGWFDAYTELLDGWKLFHYRARFNIERGQLVAIAMSSKTANVEADGSSTGERTSGVVEPVEWLPRQLDIRCIACGTSIGVSGPKLLSDSQNGVMTVASCPQCKQRLPRCVVCRMHMTFPGEPVDRLLHNPLVNDTIDESLIMCQTCRHGGHASHILGWFFGASKANGEGRKHETCPVAGCECRCLDE